jgi:hypothetical protein
MKFNAIFFAIVFPALFLLSGEFAISAALTLFLIGIAAALRTAIRAAKLSAARRAADARVIRLR